MELESGAKVAAHAGFLGAIYSYTSSKHVKRFLVRKFYSTKRPTSELFCEFLWYILML